MSYNHQSIEEKWQKRWSSERLGYALPDHRPKFFLIFAYPGVSGYLHVGHMRGFTYSDVLCRYKRMCGFNVFFPVGSHASGNVSVTFAKKVADGDPVWIQYLRDNGCPEEEIAKLGDVDEVIRFFNRVYEEDYWKRFGFLADWSSFATTTSPGYKRFIQWQFLKLHDRGLLVQKPYFATFCPVCGPVAVDPSETDISSGGGAEKQEYTLLKFKIDLGLDMPTYVLAATLRPETVFGQTNFWADPNVDYVRVKREGEYWIMSRPAAEKLVYQIDGLEIGDELSGKDMVGKECSAPGVGRAILILPARFCDPNVGTGLVTSVPSDSPVDWIALRDLQRDRKLCLENGLDWEKVSSLQPIPIIESKGCGPMPAVEICDRLGIESQEDVEKLEEAKKEVYKIGFHTGTMMENAEQYSGLPVEKAKEMIRDGMVSNGDAMLMHDLSEEVVCRCGAGVIVKRIDDQWFIKYSDAQLTEESKNAVEDMNIQPKEFRNNLPGILDWFQDRACVRMGSWLGTPFPLDSKWTIEPISDSTLYPIYYLVSKHLNNGNVTVDSLEPAFFDYVYLGIGEADHVSQETGVPKDVLDKIRKDVEYWYPLDINLGGKEHMTVHFPVFLMNHVAVLPDYMWPRGIFTHWYIVGKGSKISKSKGGAEPIPHAMEKFGVDAMRFFYCNSGSPFADVEWDEDLVASYKSRLEKLYSMFLQIQDISGNRANMDAWLESKVSSATVTLKAAMDDFNLRQATNIVYFDIPADIRWYIKRGGENKDLLRDISWRLALFMSPFTPHIAEELWDMLGGQGFSSTQPFPDEKEIDRNSLVSEEYIKQAMEDISNILKVTGVVPQKVIIYISPKWKYDVLEIVKEAVERGETNPGPIIKNIMESKPELRAMGKAVPQYVSKSIQDVRQKAISEHKNVDEMSCIMSAIEFFENEYGCTFKAFKADEAEEDPGNKARMAIPGRPAIYVH